MQQQDHVQENPWCCFCAGARAQLHGARQGADETDCVDVDACSLPTRPSAPSKSLLRSKSKTDRSHNGSVFVLVTPSSKCSTLSRQSLRHGVRVLTRAAFCVLPGTTLSVVTGVAPSLVCKRSRSQQHCGEQAAAQPSGNTLPLAFGSRLGCVFLCGGGVSRALFHYVDVLECVLEVWIRCPRRSLFPLLTEARVACVFLCDSNRLLLARFIGGSLSSF